MLPKQKPMYQNLLFTVDIRQDSVQLIFFDPILPTKDDINICN